MERQNFSYEEKSFSGIFNYSDRNGYDRLRRQHRAASAEVAAEDEWENDPTAYLSGIKASDYVELPADYSALTVEVEPAAEVADEEVENMINSYRESRKELQEITNRSVVQEGDVVNIDYVGRINGEEFDAIREWETP